MLGIAEAAGVTDAKTILDDESWDEAVRESHELAFGSAGPDIGSPVLMVEGAGRGVHGPIIDQVPGREEALAIWRRVTAPTLLVTGRESHIHGWLKDKPEEFAERKAAFRNLREIELEDCGHMMHHDQPARLARLIEDFVGS